MRGGVRLAALISMLSALLTSFSAPLAADGPRRPPRSGATPTGASTIHRVKPGDTLAKIAAHHRVTLPALLTANRLSGPDVRLRVGQRLTIPAAGTPVARTRRSMAVASAARATSPPRTLVLGQIGRAHV